MENKITKLFNITLKIAISAVVVLSKPRLLAPFDLAISFQTFQTSQLNSVKLDDLSMLVDIQYSFGYRKFSRMTLRKKKKGFYIHNKFRIHKYYKNRYLSSCFFFKKCAQLSKNPKLT